MQKATETISRYSMQETKWSEGGAFLPLSVWKTKGFDVDLIESTTDPKDIMHTPQLGKCFRVKILVTERAGAEGTHRTSLSSRTTAQSSGQSEKQPLKRDGKTAGICLAGDSAQWNEEMKKLKVERAAEVSTAKANKARALAVLKRLSEPLQKLEATMKTETFSVLPASITCAVHGQMATAIELETMADTIVDGAEGTMTEEQKIVCRVPTCLSVKI